MSPVRRIRMGMIGGGKGSFIGAVHLMASRLDGCIDLVCGAFSRDFDNTRATGAALGLPQNRLYKSAEAMIEAEAGLPADQRMDFVSIVTPNDSHAPQATAAADAGFHIMCDKPAGVSLAEVQSLRNVLQRTGVHYGLSHTYLGYPMVWQARRLINSDAFGKIRKVFVEYPQGWLGSDLEGAGNKQAEWRTDPAKAGPAGCMGDIGTHAHSLVEFVTASAMTQVMARLNTHIAGRRLDDDGDVLFELANGATGVLSASQVCTGEENALKIRVYGEKRAIEWRQMEPNTLIEKSADGPAVHYRAGTDQPLCKEALKRCRLPAGHPEGYIEAFANLYRDFADTLCTNLHTDMVAEPVPGVKSALRGMAFIEAVVKSHAKGGQPVSLACHEGERP